MVKLTKIRLVSVLKKKRIRAIDMKTVFYISCCLLCVTFTHRFQTKINKHPPLSFSFLLPPFLHMKEIITRLNDPSWKVYRIQLCLLMVKYDGFINMFGSQDESRKSWKGIDWISKLCIHTIILDADCQLNHTRAVKNKTFYEFEIIIKEGGEGFIFFKNTFLPLFSFLYEQDIKTISFTQIIHWR